MILQTVRLLFFALCALCCLTILPSWAIVQSTDEVHELLKKEKSELEKLKTKIKKQTKALSKMGKQKYSILKRQRILDDQLKSREREVKIYNWNLNINKKKIENLTINIKKNQRKLNAQRMSMISRLRSMYKEGSLYPVKILFSSDDFADLLMRVEYIERVAVNDSELFNNFNTQLNILNHEKEALLHAKSRLLQFKKSANIKKDEIGAEKLKKKIFLTQLSKEKKLNERLKDELVRSSVNLNRLIARLEKKQVLGQGLDISDKKGRLLPPVKGKFLNKFGRKRDKQFDTYIVYNGINISSPKGAPVRAIFEGQTLYTGTLEGYGNLIIIGHGKEYHSLYGHLDEIITQVGKSVRIGQIIGRTGDTGSIMGETLYFEIRYKGKPIEPIAWLNKK